MSLFPTSMNMLATCMDSTRFFKMPSEIESKLSMTGAFLEEFLGSGLDFIMGVQEVDGPIYKIIVEKVLQNPDHEFAYQEGFRFGNGLIYPKKLCKHLYSFNAMNMKLPDGVKPEVAAEWTKRESRVFIMHVRIFEQDCVLVFAHFPLSLAIPSLKVLFWDSICSKIAELFGEDHEFPVIVIADTNTLDSEPTMEYIKGASITCSNKFNPTDMVYQSRFVEYTQVSTTNFTNFATNAEGVVFKECIDRILFNPAAMKAFSMKKFDEISEMVLGESGPNKSWFSDHAPVCVGIGDVFSGLSI